MKLINFPIFLTSLAVGLLFVYIVQPKMKQIYVFPTPENIEKIQYKDKAGNHFEFDAEELDCPTEETMIERYVVQN